MGTHANSELWVALDGKGVRFTAKAGVDRDTDDPRASVEFVVHGNDRELWRSGVCRAKAAAVSCDLDLAGVTNLVLEVTDADDGQGWDHADWAEARIEYTGAAPKAVAPPAPPREEAFILTPPAPLEPRINGAKIYGTRPGSPFLYRIPATGERPMTFSAEGLPPGLVLDSAKGIITGRVNRAGHDPGDVAGAQRPGGVRAGVSHRGRGPSWRSRRRWAGTAGTSIITGSARRSCARRPIR